MFLFRRFNKSLLIVLCSVSILILYILPKYFIHNENLPLNDDYRKNEDGTKNIETIESAANVEKHDSTSQTRLIKIGDHPLSLYVHFDLKGAAPKVSYFEQLFPLLHQWGVTGVCMEYEDMFPFEGIVDSIKHKQAYTKEDIVKINQLAKENHLDVMPLLQTYGHLEFLLKIKDFSDLRENPRYPQVISPCINRTYTVLFSMIDQYLNLHPNIRYLHIGQDEVYYFLTNSACQEFKRSTGIRTNFELFGYHLNKIANYIKKKSPNIILFIWHDVLQNLNLDMLNKYDLINLINPVLWSYREDMSVEGFVTSSQAELFGKFKMLWGSTAFKGATDEIATTSDVKHYYQNQVSWIKQLHSYIPTKWQNFDGIILAGWSRYDHFLSLCELLPYSIPSMLFSIAPWQKQFSSLPNMNVHPNKLEEYVLKQLKCSTYIHLTAEEHLTKTIPRCKFPGADVYASIIHLSGIWNQVNEAELFINKYITDLHMKYKYVHIKRAEECLQKLTPVMDSIKRFLPLFIQSMNEVFPPQVAIEWLETYFIKRFRSINQRYAFIQRALDEQKAWVPRPIPNTDQFDIQ